MSAVDLQEGIATLSRGAYFKEASLDMMLSILTESAARISGVERVSIWALNNQQMELRCLDLFELSAGRHSNGQSIQASQYPVYFSALREHSCISTGDAYSCPLTTELAADYLPSSGVTAVLDTPIHIRGDLQGVLCLEQVGTYQSWTSAHGLFGQAIANLVTLALVEYEAGEAKLQAWAASERLNAAFAC